MRYRLTKEQREKAVDQKSKYSTAIDFVRCWQTKYYFTHQNSQNVFPSFITLKYGIFYIDSKTKMYRSINRPEKKQKNLTSLRFFTTQILLSEHLLAYRKQTQNMNKCRRRMLLFFKVHICCSIQMALKIQYEKKQNNCNHGSREGPSVMRSSSQATPIQITTYNRCTQYNFRTNKNRKNTSTNRKNQIRKSFLDNVYKT